MTPYRSSVSAAPSQRYVHSSGGAFDRLHGDRRLMAKPRGGNGANLGFEQTLWAAADKLRGHLDAAEYKHVVLGLIFLKYISDAFGARTLGSSTMSRQTMRCGDPSPSFLGPARFLDVITGEQLKVRAVSVDPVAPLSGDLLEKAAIHELRQKLVRRGPGDVESFLHGRGRHQRLLVEVVE
jgi:hypothetical protein